MKEEKINSFPKFVSGYFYRGGYADIVYGETDHSCEVQFFSGEKIVGKHLHITPVEGNRTGCIPMWDNVLDCITKKGEKVTQILVPTSMKEDVFKAIMESKPGEIKLRFERLGEKQ